MKKMETIKNGETPIPLQVPEAMQKSEIQQMMEKLQQEINIQREKVLKLKLAKHGIILNVEEEAKSRFKKVVCEIKDGVETYYFNNGTREGIRIVSMEIVQSKLEDGKFQYQLKHY